MPDNGPSGSVPDELVEVAARAVAHTGYSFKPEKVARAVLSAVFEAGWVRKDDCDRRIVAASREGYEACLALAEALKEIKRIAAIEAPPVSEAVPAKVWQVAFDALRVFRESKETGDVR